MGTFFAVYWLMRFDSDGAQSFSFGLSSHDWKPLNKNSARPVRLVSELEKREAFNNDMDWTLFRDVLVAAGMLKQCHADDTVGYTYEQDEDRVLAMLVLTAIHDIMKIQALVPCVQPVHKQYGGYKTGEAIGDHDVALGYILENYPHALPSFAGLPCEQRESVKFTQAKMEYNMGWLVQAEAPPGPLFKKFRSIIRSGGASPRDVAFYFAHWLTDLAGAEACPQEGCEKFVLKFPHRVLTSFLSSFAFVQNLESKTETQVFEEYLEWRWKTQMPPLGGVPDKSGSIAQLRLVTMAQIPSDKILEGFADLNEQDRQVLSEELARTGCRGQVYARDLVRDCRGPAFLIYYSPALLTKNGKEDARGVLAVLAEIFRRARDLWPLEEKAQDQSVTIRVDAIKDLDLQSIRTVQAASYWALQQTSSVDAMVSKMSLIGLQTFPNNRRVLDFGDVGSSYNHFRASLMSQELPKNIAASPGGGLNGPSEAMPRDQSWCGVFGPCGCGSGTPVTEVERTVEANI